MKLIKTIFWILAFMGLGFLLILNVQPWLELAEQLAKQVKVIPFIDTITKIPYLGGWAEWGAVNLSKLLGVVLWGIVQFIEILPMLIKNPGTYKGIVKRWEKGMYEVDRSDRSEMSYFKRQYNRLPKDWMQSLSSYRAFAYAVETVVCFLKYPPYEGGIDAVIGDAPNWDFQLIDWWNLLFFVITMFGVEVVVRVLLRIWQGFDFMSLKAPWREESK